MKKAIILSILTVLTFLIGFWIGRTHFPITSQPNEETNTENDIEKEVNEYFPIYTVKGGLPKIDDKYRYIVDRWYGFRFRTTGSTCTDADKSINIEKNKKADSILTKRIGNNWMEKFEKTVDSLYTIDTLATNIAQNDASVKKLIQLKLSKNTKKVYPSYNCYPTNDTSLKAVSIEWEGEIYNKTSTVSYMRVMVDINEKKVKKIEDTEIKANLFAE